MANKTYEGQTSKDSSKDSRVEQLTGIVSNLYFARTGEKLPEDRIQAGVEGMVALYDLVQTSQYNPTIFYQGMSLLIPQTAYDKLGINESAINDLLSKYFSSQKYNPNTLIGEKKSRPEHYANLELAKTDYEE